MTLNPNLFPPEGYRFVDADGVEHFGQSLEQLVKHLGEYRVRVGRPPGDPHREVMDYLCGRFPDLCVPDEAELQRRVVWTRVMGSISKWVHERSGEGPATISSQEEVNRRVAICDQCPLNVEWTSPCRPCGKLTAKLLAGLTHPAKPVAALEGRACLNAGDDLSVAVWLSEGLLLSGVPAKCWRGDAQDSPSNTQKL